MKECKRKKMAWKEKAMGEVQIKKEKEKNRNEDER